MLEFLRIFEFSSPLSSRKFDAKTIEWHRSQLMKKLGVRTKRYKLMHFYYDIDAWELYDLQKDPNELNNLYDIPAYADVVKKLKAELRRRL